MSSPEAQTPAVIRCECGWECRAQSREETAAAMRRHLVKDHPDLQVTPKPADLLAMTEEE